MSFIFAPHEEVINIVQKMMNDCVVYDKYRIRECIFSFQNKKKTTKKPKNNKTQTKVFTFFCGSGFTRIVGIACVIFKEY